MSESVDIIIKAEDLATPVVQQSARAVDGLDASLKKVKESGSQAKKSADFARIIASSLGGSEIGNYIGQMGEAADKTAQFAEVQKLGGAGAVAFKIGLVGLVGTIAFGIGNALGNVIFQTEKWSKKLAEANEQAKKLAGQAANIQSVKFSENKEDVELIADPEQKKQAYSDLLKSIRTELVGVESAVVKGKKEVAEWDAAWMKTGNRAAFAEQAKAKLADDQSRLDVMNAQRLEIEKMLGPRHEENEAIKQKNALQTKSDDYVASLRSELELLRASKEEQAGILSLRNAIGESAQDEVRKLLVEKETIALNAEDVKQKAALVSKSSEYVAKLRDEVALLKLSGEERDAMQASQDTVGGDTAIAAALISEKNLLIENREIEKKAIADKESESKRIADLKESELQKLEEERILLTQGKEAAAAFALEKQGLSKGDAARIAKERSVNEAMKQKDQKLKIDETNLVASESRLLSRGKVDNAGATTAANTATLVQQNSEQRQQMQAMTAYLQKIANKREPEFEEVS